MTPARACALLFSCVLLPLFPAPPVRAETLFLTDPQPAVVETDPSSLFTIEGGALRAIRGLFSFAPPGRQPLRPTLSFPHLGRQGDLLRIDAVEREGFSSLSAELTGPQGIAVSHGLGFRVGDTGGGERWAAFLGVPAGARSGLYRLAVSITDGERRCELIGFVEILARDFLTEKIPLTQALTALRKNPDPKKTEESVRLGNVLSTPHPDALYEIGTLLPPFTDFRRTAGFGDRREYLYSDATANMSIHAGVDIAAPEGTPVLSGGKGKVVFAGYRIMTGGSVVIEHLPGLFSLYFHLSSIRVKKGDLVEKGQPIGSVGMTGLATGPHLHWEVRALGVAVDPDILTRSPLLAGENGGHGPGT